VRIVIKKNNFTTSISFDYKNQYKTGVAKFMHRDYFVSTKEEISKSEFHAMIHTLIDSLRKHGFTIVVSNVPVSMHKTSVKFQNNTNSLLQDILRYYKQVSFYREYDMMPLNMMRRGVH